jgi:hypothetical protein
VAEEGDSIDAELVCTETEMWYKKSPQMCVREKGRVEVLVGEEGGRGRGRVADGGREWRVGVCNDQPPRLEVKSSG